MKCVVRLHRQNVLLENAEHALCVGGLGQFLTVEPDSLSRRKHTRRIDEPPARIDTTMKLQILFRRQHFAGGKFDQRALRCFRFGGEADRDAGLYHQRSRHPRPSGSQVVAKRDPVGAHLQQGGLLNCC